MSGGRSLGERVFAWLLCLYPRGLRDRYREDFLAFYGEHRREPRFAGLAGGLRFWNHTLADLFRTAISERRTGRADDPSAPRSGRNGTAGRGARWSGEIRSALRGLRRDPLFSLVAIVTLALGIGATTAVFSVVHAVLMTPLDHPEPDALVRVYERQRDNPDAIYVAYGNYADLRDEPGIFEHLVIWTWDSRTLTGIDRGQRIRARAVSANLAAAFGAEAAIGRFISADEEREGSNVLVLSDALWRSTFGADEGVVGRTVRLDGEPFVVIGVMERGFEFPIAEAWTPLPPLTDPRGVRNWHRHNMVGRLAEGVSVEEANRAMDVVAGRLAVELPESNSGDYFEAVSLLDNTVGAVRPALRLLFAGVGALLLIACVNLVSLALARAAKREPELALRRALGGTTGRIAQLLVTESLLLALAGGTLGLLVARGGIRVVALLSADSIPRLETVSVSVPVFAFASFVTIATGVVVGLAPIAWSGRRPEAGAAGVLHGGRSSAGARTVRTMRLLVTAELAAALVLTVGAGLLVRSFNALQSVDLGVETEGLLSLDVRLPSGELYGGPPGGRFMEGLLAEIEALPGVERAAAVLTPPANPNGWMNLLTIQDRPLPRNETPPIRYNVVSSGYFETVGMGLVEGRTFRPDEPLEGQPVAVINRAAADRYWPGEEVIGSEILGSADGSVPFARVIGVVENARQSLVEPADPEAFVPIAHDFVLEFVVLARSGGDPLSVATLVDDAFRRADPDIPITNVATFEHRLGDAVARPRFNAALMSGFAVTALILASVGVYGVLAYSVAARRREFGVRIAVGASKARVLRSVLREAAISSAAAAGIGLATALALRRLLGSLLFGVTPADATTLAVSAGTMVVVALAAALLPASSATCVDPAIVLRDD